MPDVTSPLLTLDAPVTVIERRRGWRKVDWRELWAYRDLFRFLVLRGIRARYAQSVIGVGWADIRNHALFMVGFGVLFNAWAILNYRKTI